MTTTNRTKKKSDQETVGRGHPRNLAMGSGSEKQTAAPWIIDLIVWISSRMETILTKGNSFPKSHSRQMSKGPHALFLTSSVSFVTMEPDSLCFHHFFPSQLLLILGPRVPGLSHSVKPVSNDPSVNLLNT